MNGIHDVRAVGVDLGTTFSAVACIDAHGRPTTLTNSAGNLTTPSVVLFADDGTHVGEEAVAGAPLEIDRVAECVKRDMGAQHFRAPIKGEFLPPEVVSSLILKKLLADAQRRIGPVSHAVITVPAYFDEPRRQATIRAAQLAGVSVLDIINEPTAAAIAYGFHRGYLDQNSLETSAPLRVLVYDLGGGTFDVTLMDITQNSFRVIATDGDVKLGGRDWDRLLVDELASRFLSEHREDPRSNPESLFDLYRCAELAKKTLSERQQATVVVTHVGTRLKTVITRDELESRSAPLLERTRITTELVMQQARVGWQDVDHVILVGGSTRMPMVSAMLRSLTGKEPDRSVSPDEAVAHGAALYAGMLVRRKGLSSAGLDFDVVDVSSHSLGIIGTNAASGRPVNKVIIPKNTPLPASVTRHFKTARRGQTTLLIRVAEGDSPDPEACTLIGKFVVRGLPHDLPKGSPVEVSYAYDSSGCLRVSAKATGHAAHEEVEFVRDGELSEDDILKWGQRIRKADENTFL